MPYNLKKNLHKRRYPQGRIWEGSRVQWNPMSSKKRGLEPSEFHRGSLEPSSLGTFWNPLGPRRLNSWFLFRSVPPPNKKSSWITKISGTPGTLWNPLEPSGTPGTPETLWNPLDPSGTLSRARGSQQQPEGFTVFSAPMGFGISFISAPGYPIFNHK